MNKNVVFVSVVIMAIVGIIAGAVLAIFKPEGFLTFTGFIGTTIIVVTGFAASFYALNKVSEKVERVDKQTNGTLSKKDEDLKQRDLIIVQTVAMLPWWKRRQLARILDRDLGKPRDKEIVK